MLDRARKPSFSRYSAKTRGLCNNDINDGWNRPLTYQINEDGVITLTSLGKDGKIGGTGENADISKSYYTRREDGSLWIGDEMWIMEAVVRKLSPFADSQLSTSVLMSAAHRFCFSLATSHWPLATGHL